MRHSSSQPILRFAHVFALIFGEHLGNRQCAFTPSVVDLDLEVAARLHGLAVKVPGDGRLGYAAEHDAQKRAVTVKDLEDMTDRSLEQMI